MAVPPGLEARAADAGQLPNAKEGLKRHKSRPTFSPLTRAPFDLGGYVMKRDRSLSASSHWLGGTVAAALLVSGRRHFGEYLPFGPFLAVGGIVAAVWGRPIMEWYLG